MYYYVLKKSKKQGFEKNHQQKKEKWRWSCLR